MKSFNFCLFFIIIIFSGGCKKDSIEKDIVKQTSQSHVEGFFKKELIVSDVSGKNEAIYAIYANDSNQLNHFLATRQLSLSIEKEGVMEKSGKISQKPNQFSSETKIDTNT